MVLHHIVLEVRRIVVGHRELDREDLVRGQSSEEGSVPAAPEVVLGVHQNAVLGEDPAGLRNRLEVEDTGNGWAALEAVRRMIVVGIVGRNPGTGPAGEDNRNSCLVFVSGA